jgi:hypothetical protein
MNVDIYEAALEPFLDAALKQDDSGFKSGIFAFNLTKEGDSELYIGGTGDSNLLEQDIEYHHVLGSFIPSYWMIGNGKIEVDSKPITAGISTIIDSGTDMIVGPLDYVKKIYEKIPGSHRTETPGRDYAFPCDAKIPEISFSWGGGKKWTMDRER